MTQLEESVLEKFCEGLAALDVVPDALPPLLLAELRQGKGPSAEKLAQLIRDANREASS